MALAFISIFGSLLWRFLLSLRYHSRPGAKQFPVSLGQRLLLYFKRVLLHVVRVLLCLVFGAS